MNPHSFLYAFLEAHKEQENEDTEIGDALRALRRFIKNLSLGPILSDENNLKELLDERQKKDDA